LLKLQVAVTRVLDYMEPVDGIDAALMLLLRVFYMENFVKELATELTFTTLIDYIILIRNPHQRALRILYAIIR
jgi:hypothetical protein